MQLNVKTVSNMLIDFNWVSVWLGAVLFWWKTPLTKIKTSKLPVSFMCGNFQQVQKLIIGLWLEWPTFWIPFIKIIVKRVLLKGKRCEVL